MTGLSPGDLHGLSTAHYPRKGQPTRLSKSYGRTDHVLSVLVSEGPIAVLAPIPARVPCQHARLKTKQAQGKVQRGAPPVRGEVRAARPACQVTKVYTVIPILCLFRRVLVSRDGGRTSILQQCQAQPDKCNSERKKPPAHQPHLIPRAIDPDAVDLGATPAPAS